MRRRKCHRKTSLRFAIQRCPWYPSSVSHQEQASVHEQLCQLFFRIERLEKSLNKKGMVLELGEKACIGCCFQASTSGKGPHQLTTIIPLLRKSFVINCFTSWPLSPPWTSPTVPSFPKRYASPTQCLVSGHINSRFGFHVWHFPAGHRFASRPIWPRD